MSSSTTCDVDTLQELQKTNELLVELVGRVKKTEARVRNIGISFYLPLATAAAAVPLHGDSYTLDEKVCLPKFKCQEF